MSQIATQPLLLCLTYGCSDQQCPFPFKTYCRIHIRQVGHQMKLVTGFSGEQLCAPRSTCNAADTAVATAEGRRLREPGSLKNNKASVFKKERVNDNTGDLLLSAGQVKFNVLSGGLVNTTIIQYSIAWKYIWIILQMKFNFVYLCTSLDQIKTIYNA